jgi:hypothetical protein
MKLFALLLCRLIFFCILLLHLPALASHELGANLSYTYVGPNQYLVTLKYFRDCFGISAPPNLKICYQSTSCAVSDSLVLNQNINVINIPPNPYIPPQISSCNGGSGFGVELYFYQGLLTLPGNCTDWVISYTSTSFLLTNEKMVVKTNIYNLNNTINHSLFFTAYPIFDYCVGQQAYVISSPSDPDNDSIHCSIVSTLLDSMQCPSQPYATTQQLQIPSSIPYYIHPQDGWYTFNPSAVAL